MKILLLLIKRNDIFIIFYKNNILLLKPSTVCDIKPVLLILECKLGHGLL